MTRRTFLAAPALSTAALANQPPKVRLIIHADDVGVSHSTNVACLQMLEKGHVSSASVMMPCAWVAQVADWFQRNQAADLGLHMTLTSEWKTMRWAPVADASKVPGLIDKQGYMWPDVRSVAMNATAAEVETELRAQIARAQRMGIKFTHLDTHMGTVYARPDFFNVYYNLGREFGVPIMVMKPAPEAEKQGSKEIVAFLKTQQDRFAKDKIFVLDTLIPDPVRGAVTLNERRERYVAALEALPPGIHQLILHPAKLDDELRSMTGSAVARDLDFQVFSDPQVHARLTAKGISLAKYRDFIA
ncbi:MAG: hypothetical protein C0504_06575 [Candidatus Solibacter sp.]|nr:hypothetical protein [Candidatus Solibacter sp.]